MELAANALQAKYAQQASVQMSPFINLNTLVVVKKSVTIRLPADAYPFHVKV